MKLKWTWSRQLTSREKILLQVLGVVAITTVFLVYLYLPMVAKGRELDTQIGDLTSANSRLMAQSRQSNAMDLEIASINEKLAKLAVQLPVQKEVPQFITMLDDAGSKSGVHFREVRLGDLVDKKDHGEVNVDMTVSGEFPAITKFVKSLENLPRTNRISQWKLADRGNRQVDLSLTTVIFVDPKAMQEIRPDIMQGTFPIGRSNLLDSAPSGSAMTDPNLPSTKGVPNDGSGLPAVSSGTTDPKSTPTPSGKGTNYEAPSGK